MMKKFIIDKISLMFPQLESQLMTARIPKTSEEFIMQTLKASLNLFGLIIFIFVLFGLKKPDLVPILTIMAPTIFVGMFFYLMQYPVVKVFRLSKDISKEIVFAGRFLIIELESGVPLYNAMLNVIPSYPAIGKYFNEVITKVDFGTPMEDAINDAVIYSPSANLRRLFWQVLNSLKTGSDIHKSLDSVVDQIMREQVIEVKAYAKKLNPLAMFYMMMAIIIPTLGTAMLAVAANFISIEISLPILVVLSMGLGFTQMMFLNIIKSQRPAVDF